MPILKYTINGSQLLSPGALPINFNLTIPSISFGGTPDTPIELSGSFDFGIEVTFTCPGFPFCQAKKACQTVKKTPVWRMDPQSIISTKIPGIPSLPKLPTIPTIQFSFPPKFMLPLECPNYIRAQQNAADGGK